MRLIASWQEGLATLKVAPSAIRFRGAIVDLVRNFEEGFWGRDLEYKDSDLNESTKM